MRYRLQRHDGTDCSATMVPITVLRMVPIQRYRQKMIMQTNIDWQLLTGSNIPFFPFMFILLPVTWLIVGFSNFSSKAIVPRWSIVVNPVILTIILSIVTWIIPKTECLLPGIFSLGITLYYIICWISLKKDRNLCLKRKF